MGRKGQIPVYDGDGYPSRFKQECRAIFLSARSFAGVVRELKRRGYQSPPATTTLARWAADEGWREELARRDRIDEAELDPKNDDLDAFYREVRAMRKVAREKIVRAGADGKPEIMDSTSQDFYAYRGLAETEAKILEAINRIERQRAQETPVEVIFRALKRHPKIGKLLADPEVQAEIKEYLALEQLETMRAQAANAGVK